MAPPPSQKRKYQADLNPERPVKHRKVDRTEVSESEAPTQTSNSGSSNPTLKRKADAHSESGHNQRKTGHATTARLRAEEQDQGTSLNPVIIDGSPKEYKVRNIIGETRTKYRIDWADDPVTGEKFEPTWEPKSFVNAAAIEDWENQLREKAAPRPRTYRSRSTKGRAPPSSLPDHRRFTAPPERSTPNDSVNRFETGRPTRSRRLQRVIHSSQESSQPTQPAGQSSSTAETISDSNDTSSQPPSSHFTHAEQHPNTFLDQDLLVNITQRSDFDAAQYQPFSSSFSTQKIDAELDLRVRTELQLSHSSATNSSPLLSNRRFPRVIPDSQTSEEVSSFELEASQKASNLPSNGLDNASSLEVPSSNIPPAPKSSLISDPIEDPSSSEAEREHRPAHRIVISSDISESSASTPPPVHFQGESQEFQASFLSSSEESQHIALRNSQEPPAGQGDAYPLPSFTEQDLSSFSKTSAHLSGTKPDSNLQPSLGETEHGTSTNKEAVSSTLSASSSRLALPSQFNPLAKGLSDIRFAERQSHPRETNSEPSVPISETRESGHNSIATDTAFQTQISPLFRTGIAKETEQSQASGEFITQPPQSFGTDFSQGTFQARQILSQDLDWRTESLEETRASEVDHSSHFSQQQNSLDKPLPPPQHRSKTVQLHSSAGFESYLYALGQSGRVASSSNIPEAPSEAPDTFLSNRQSRPLTPEAADMSDPPQHQASSPSSVTASSPGAAVRERLRALRASAAAARSGNGPIPTSSPMNVSQQTPPRIVREGVSTPSSVSEGSPNPADLPEGAKSPSVIPDRPPVPPSSSSLGPKPVRVQELHTSHVPIQHSPLALHKERTTPEEQATNPLQLRPMEFVVPLGMYALARDQYAQAVYNYRSAIEDFTAANEDESSSSSPSKDQPMGSEEKTPSSWHSQLEEMLSRANKVANHNDLNDEGTLTQQHVTPEDEAKWAVHCSTKFEFLQCLFERFRTQEVHIAILAESGRLLDIIETFLKGLHIVYTRPDTLSRSDTTAFGYLRVGLLATGEAGSAAMVGSADLVVAFDNTFNAADHQVQGLRSSFFEIHKLSPVIHLTIVNSVEHAQRCLPPSVQGTERLQLLVRAVANLRNEVGELPPEYPTTDHAAEKVFEFVQGGSIESEWQLPQLADIIAAELLSDSQTSNSTSRSGTSSETRPRGSIRSREKRPLLAEEDDEHSPRKRGRTSPGADNAVSSGIDVTHVSDSIVERPDLLSSGDINNPSPTQKEAELYSTIEAAQSNLQKHIQAMDALQTRYEEQREELHQLRKDREAARIAMAQSERRRETQLAEITKLKDEKASLQRDLNDARSALVNSAIPEISELEKARAEARELREAKQRLERRVESIQRDFEFTRTQYQNASSAAVEASQESASLRSENETLRQKASGEAAKLKQLNANQATILHTDRIKELEATLHEREELLKRKDEEIIRLRGRGGLATRSTSVPRSPRSHSRASSPSANSLGVGNGGLGISRASYLRSA